MTDEGKNQKNIKFKELDSGSNPNHIRTENNKKDITTHEEISKKVDAILLIKNLSTTEKNNEKNHPTNRDNNYLENKKTFNIFNKKISVKNLLSIVIIFLLISVIIPSILPLVYGDSNSEISISISPENIRNGDPLYINATIPVFYNIQKVNADIGGIETIELILQENSSEDQFWKAIWAAHDVEIGEHIIKITAIDEFNLSYYAEVRWTVSPYYGLENSEILEINNNETNAENSSSIFYNETYEDIENTTYLNENLSTNTSTTDEPLNNTDPLETETSSDKIEEQVFLNYNQKNKGINYIIWKESSINASELVIKKGLEQGEIVSLYDAEIGKWKRYIYGYSSQYDDFKIQTWDVIEIKCLSSKNIIIETEKQENTPVIYNFKYTYDSINNTGNPGYNYFAWINDEKILASDLAELIGIEQGCVISKYNNHESSWKGYIHGLGLDKTLQDFTIEKYDIICIKISQETELILQ